MEKRSLCDLKRDEVDSFYYKHLDFDPSGSTPTRVKKILDLLTLKLGDGRRPKLINYEAISLFLLIDSLLDDYAPSWEDRLAPSLDAFRAKALATKGNITSPSYVEWFLPAKVGSDRRENIERRHAFFTSQMLTLLDPLAKDTKRSFNELERQTIYHRDSKRCGVCRGFVEWTEAESHHIVPHATGGQTALSNGALVHKLCHPLSQSAVSTFASSWRSIADLDSGAS